MAVPDVKLPLPATDITSSANSLVYRHEENHFAEFDREPLIPHMASTEGPALAVGDMKMATASKMYLLGASKGKEECLVPAKQLRPL